MTNKELQSRAIDVLRFPLAVMVVAIHTYFCEALKAPGNVDVPFSGEWAHELITFFSIVLTDAAVPTFFVISGYLFFIKVDPYGSEKYDWGGYFSKIKRKCLTLLVPYLMWNTVAFVIEPAHFSKSITDVLTGFYSIDGHGPWDGPLWFMRDLFLMMLISPTLEWGIKWLKWLFPFGLWYIYVSHNFGDHIIPGLSYVSFAFFSLGGYIGMLQKDFIAHIRRHRLLVFSMYFIMMISRIVTMHQWGDINVGATTVSSLVDMLYIIATIPAWFGIASYIGEYTNHLKIWRWLASSGFVVYAMHRLFNSKVSAAGLLLLGKPEISGIDAVVLYFATIIISALVCIATYWVFTKNKITEVLFLGARNKR